MATADQVKALISSHFSEDKERFYSIVLQIAAYEASRGHSSLARELREIVDESKLRKSRKIIDYPIDLQGLVYREEPFERLSNMVLPDALKARLIRIIHEYAQKEKLKRHGLKHRRKILLLGPSGTGKTMTAKVIANQLKLSLQSIQMDKLVTKFVGEAGAKLRLIFNHIQMETGVYLFDEFDAIGGERSLENDVGEMRRVLGSYLQFIEQDPSDSIIIAVTNSPEILDRALFRRFDDVLTYQMPDANERIQLVRNTINRFMDKNVDEKAIIEASKGLSQAEIVSACNDSIKNAILNDMQKVEHENLIKAFSERKVSF